MSDAAILPHWCRQQDSIAIAKVRAHTPVDAQSDLQAAIGFAAPDADNCFTGGDALMIAAIGVNEWLLLGESARLADVAARIDATLRAQATLVVDISSGRCTFDLFGAEAMACLAAMTPLDLRNDTFPVGFAGRTRFGDIGLFVARLDGGQILRVVIDQIQEEYFLRMIHHPF